MEKLIKSFSKKSVDSFRKVCYYNIRKRGNEHDREDLLHREHCRTWRGYGEHWEQFSLLHRQRVHRDELFTGNNQRKRRRHCKYWEDFSTTCVSGAKPAWRAGGGASANFQYNIHLQVLSSGKLHKKIVDFILKFVQFLVLTFGFFCGIV